MLAAVDLDEILTLQLAVAWAGESVDDEERRFGWRQLATWVAEQVPRSGTAVRGCLDMGDSNEN